MEKKFTSDELPLAQLLDQAARGELQLPDFQRGWVWDDDHIRSLLASISLSYPIGAVMTLVAGNPDVNFKARVLEGVASPATPAPDTLLLDGQQRLTSLFQALKSRAPVATRDSRGNELGRYYYASINACIEPEVDREEEGIVGVPSNRVVRSDFGRRIDLDLRTRELEVSAEMFPLEIVLDGSDTMDWQMAYLQSGPGDQPKRVEKWKRFQEAIINPFVQYHVPTIDLAKSTPKEAVCQVFEKVNTGGVTLTVFELLTATYAAGDFELRKDWEERHERLAQHELLTAVDGKAFLQIVTLLATYDRRHSPMQSNPGDDKVPAVSCKRRDVLRLSLDDYRTWACVAERGLIRVVPFLHSHRIFRSRDLPYATQLLPLGAIFGWLKDQAELYAPRQLLGQWFWCGVLGEMYGGAAETRFANDLEDCVAWIEDGGDGAAPRTVQAAQFQAERLLTLRTRNSAAYKGLYALEMKQGGRDFKTGQPIDIHAYMEDAIDIHHIFPRHWCDEHGIQQWIANSIVNKTALDAHTNRRIGGNAPSVYLSRIETGDGIESHVLDGFLRTHDIDPLALRRDDFAQFFNQRFESQLRQVERAMGKPVNRRPDRSESPFAEQGVSIDGGGAVTDRIRRICRRRIQIDGSVQSAHRGARSGDYLVGCQNNCRLHEHQRWHAAHWHRRSGPPDRDRVRLPVCEGTRPRRLGALVDHSSQDRTGTCRRNGYVRAILHPGRSGDRPYRCSSECRSGIRFAKGRTAGDLLRAPQQLNGGTVGASTTVLSAEALARIGASNAP